MGKGDGLVEGRPNLDQRDPNDINDHLKVSFEDIFAEPDATHSNDCVWLCGYNCFTCSKNCCYRFLACLCGWLYAFCWGCNFGAVTFCHVWNLTPCLREFAIECGFCQRLWGTTVQCLLAPVCETCALCFSRVQVVNTQ